MGEDRILFEWGFIQVNTTILCTWIAMAVLVIGSALATRKLSSGREMSRWQNMLEVIVSFIRSEIRGISNQDPDTYVPFIGTIFLFIAMSAVLELVPGFSNPMASLYSPVALAICVFIAVPVFGIMDQGVGPYLKNYVKPSVFMLPFNVLGELTRTLALAVRLFGNMMSGSQIIGILLSIVPYVLPIVWMFMGLLFGMIQAYIFAILAMVYIASGMRTHAVGGEGEKKEEETTEIVENA